MILAWIGLALLSASWLFAIGYFTQPNLSLSWLVEYFGGTGAAWFDPPLWPLIAGAGIVCLALSKAALERNADEHAARPASQLGLIASLFAFFFCLPALVVMPWPYRTGPLLLAVGLVLNMVAVSSASPGRSAADAPRSSAGAHHRWARWANAALLAGCVIVIQGVVLEWYQAHTAYSHELPGPLAHVVGAVGRCLGIDLAVTESTVALHSMRRIHLLGATWELLLDPASLCLFAGGLVLLAWQCRRSIPGGRRFARWLFGALALTLLLICWLPVRSGLFMALFLNDTLRIPYEADVDSMRLFWDPLLHGLFLVPPLLLAWRFLPSMDGPEPDDGTAAEPPVTQRTDTGHLLPGESMRSGRAAAAAARFGFGGVVGCLLAGVGVASLTLAIVWDPVGRRQGGRVVVEEYHPDPEQVWEKTWTPMDTQWYGQMSGYNYYCLYQYLTHFYRMERHNEAPLSDDSLNDSDVLIIKVPTRPFSAAEVETIVRFVERGGGLMLIGEHTNYQRSSTFMNPIARRFGFEFRTDNVYGMRGKIYEIPYQPALVPHPLVQHAQTLNFATPCSIAARPYSGRAAIRGLALKNLPADYHAYANYMPQPGDRAESRYGTFVQIWSTRHGKGRVVAFTDSTIFSNFSAFEPDTAELMLGMIQWLKHRPPPVNPRPWLLIAGALLLAGGAWLARVPRGGWIVIVAAGLCGWTVAVGAARLSHSAALPLPQEREKKPDLPEELRDKVDVVIDRTVCRTPLPVSGFIAGGADSYGLFERWILRLGYFTSRRDATANDRDVFGEELVVFLNPDRPADGAFRQRLVDYVAEGGKVLVVESPLVTRRSPAEADEHENEPVALQRTFVNQLLEPFGILVDHGRDVSGTLTVPDGWPQVPVEQALAVEGGSVFASVDGVPVGVSRRHGKGLVVVVGFGNRFVDDNMGYSDQTEPDDDLRQVFKLQFRLIREMVESVGSSFPGVAGN